MRLGVYKWLVHAVWRFDVLLGIFFGFCKPIFWGRARAEIRLI